jgi:hypothetical protein
MLRIENLTQEIPLLKSSKAPVSWHINCHSLGARVDVIGLQLPKPVTE